MARRRWEDYIRMYLKEIGIITRNLGDSVEESPCECGIELPCSISHIIRDREIERDREV